MEPKYRVDFDWSEDRKKRASELFAAGTSAEAIGQELGCTRNAIIGKMRRMGVASPTKPGGSGRPPAKPKAPTVPRPPVARPNMQTIRARSANPPDVPVERFFAKDHVAPVATRQRLEGLTDTSCRFPCDTDPDGHQWFCGALKAEGMVYCGGHCRIAYQPNSMLRRRGQYATSGD